MPLIDGTDSSLIQSVFDALPSRIFVVDNDVCIHAYNSAAAELLSAPKSAVLHRRGGEALECIHSKDDPKGCGKGPLCKSCTIRNSVTEALRGKRIIRRRTRLDLKWDEKKIEIYALISAAPFQFKNTPYVLLTIEDISDLMILKNMIPICSVCHKIRDEKEAWYRVEAYFQERWDVDFSHSL